LAQNLNPDSSLSSATTKTNTKGSSEKKQLTRLSNIDNVRGMFL
jgi:hypothetical protein